MSVSIVRLCLIVGVCISIAQARYFGPRMYEDDEGLSLRGDSNDDLYGGFEETNQDQNVIMAPLNAFQPPISPDVEVCNSFFFYNFSISKLDSDPKCRKTQMKTFYL